MRKIDLILENIRDEYMINLLEEGSVSELETLKTKKFLNENLYRIREMLIEEGALDGVKNHLANNWGKYLAGAGALGAGAAAHHYGLDDRLTNIANMEMKYGDKFNAIPAIEGTLKGTGNQIADDISGAYDKVAGAASGAYDKVADAAGGAYDSAKETLGGAYDSAKETLGKAADATEAAADRVSGVVGGAATISPQDLYAMAQDETMPEQALAAKQMLAAQGLAGAAGLGAAGYGAKKALDRYKR
jgi:hypothetical protein